jgi:homoserine kinase type II
LAQHTTLSREDIEAISAKYYINNIGVFKLLNGGSKNKNYLIESESGRFVFTICELKTEKMATELGHLLEHVEKHHFETSRLIRNINNSPLSFFNGKPVMVKRFVEGKIIKKLPHHLIELLGIELAKLHKIDVPEYLPLQANNGKEHFKSVKEYAPNSLFDKWLLKKLAYVLPYLAPTLPKALIHADVFSDNVIINKDENAVVIMDFEEAVHYYRIFDVGMTIIGVCREGKTINFEKVRYLLKGYQQEIQLLDIEIHALQACTVYAGAAMTFWRHSHFNYIKPDSKLSNHYEALQAVTDYIEDQPADCFIKLVNKNTL